GNLPGLFILSAWSVDRRFCDLLQFFSGNFFFFKGPYTSSCKNIFHCCIHKSIPPASYIYGHFITAGAQTPASLMSPPGTRENRSSPPSQQHKPLWSSRSRHEPDTGFLPPFRPLVPALPVFPLSGEPLPVFPRCAGAYPPPVKYPPETAPPGLLHPASVSGRFQPAETEGFQEFLPGQSFS